MIALQDLSENIYCAFWRVEHGGNPGMIGFESQQSRHAVDLSSSNVPVHLVSSNVEVDAAHNVAVYKCRMVPRLAELHEETINEALEHGRAQVESLQPHWAKLLTYRFTYLSQS